MAYLMVKPARFFSSVSIGPGGFDRGDAAFLVPELVLCARKACEMEPVGGVEVDCREVLFNCRVIMSADGRGWAEAGLGGLGRRGLTSRKVARGV